MANLNRIEIIGNVGSEPEMRFTPSGKPVTSFNVAVNDKAGENSETTWFRVTAWNKLAETCNQYINKGSMVFVDGRLKVNKWQTQDGVDKQSIEIISNKVIFLSKKHQEEADEKLPFEPDEVPF